MGWKNWNDRLALLLLTFIPGMWLLSGKGIISFAPEVTGALIATWTLVVQYYFRKSPPDDKTPTP